MTILCFRSAEHAAEVSRFCEQLSGCRYQVYYDSFQRCWKIRLVEIEERSA